MSDLMSDVAAAFGAEKTNFERQRDYWMHQYLCGRLIASQAARLILESIKTYTKPETPERANALIGLREFVDFKWKAAQKEISPKDDAELIAAINELMPSPQETQNKALLGSLGMALA